MTPIDIINKMSPIKKKNKMTEEQFLILFRKTKNVIDDAVSCQKAIGMPTFFEYFEKYKRIIFDDYTEECLEASSFKEYVWHMMNMTQHLDNQIPKEKKYITPSNVVNFYDYYEKKAVS